jgi:hypothetical protein
MTRTLFRMDPPESIARGDIVWTQNRETGRQHRWVVLIPETVRGTVLARNPDNHIQRDLDPDEWRKNPADFDLT